MSFAPINDRYTTAIRRLTGLFGVTWRYNVRASEMKAPGPCVYAFWHEFIFPVLFFYRNSGMGVVVSSSRDGRRMAGILEKWGYEIIWGSSTRGGENVLEESVKNLCSGKSVIITPDGPRGPRRQARRGAALMSFRAGVPVVGITVGCGATVRLGTWDKLLIPLPFCRIDITHAGPVFPPREGEENSIMPEYIKKIQGIIQP